MDREQEDSGVPRKEQQLGHRAEKGFFDIAHTSLSGLLVPAVSLEGYTPLGSKPSCKSVRSLSSS